jgi:hypothetical protein
MLRVLPWIMFWCDADQEVDPVAVKQHPGSDNVEHRSFPKADQWRSSDLPKLEPPGSGTIRDTLVARRLPCLSDPFTELVPNWLLEDTWISLLISPARTIVNH